MKKSFLSKILASLMFAFTLFAVSSCENIDDHIGAGDPVDEVPSIESLENDYADFIYYDLNCENNFVDENFTLNMQPIQNFDNFRGNEDDRDKGRGNKDKRRGPREIKFGSHLGFVLYMMDLTDEQKTQVQTIMENYRNCFFDVMKDYFTARKAAMETARAAIKTVIEDYRAGNIDRDAAIAQIKTIREDLKETLKATFDKDALCLCYETMTTAIEALLTPDQLAIWERYKALRQSLCDEEAEDDTE